jgi:hypothetical protein
MSCRGYIIHLKRATDRRRQAEAFAASLPMPAELLDAVDGKAMSAAALQERARRDLHSPRYPFPLANGEIACFLSHRRAWQVIIDSGCDAGLIAERKLWETALRRLEAGEMPPQDRSRPTPAEAEAFTTALRKRYAAADLRMPADPGRVTMRRLNRVEYRNTIRDLVGVDFDPTADFPSDEIGYGFDTIGDVLTLSPLLLERYLDAAEAVLLVQDRIPRRVHQHRIIDGDAALRVIGDAEDAIKRGKRIDARLRHHHVRIPLQGSHRWHFHRTNRRGDDD